MQPPRARITMRRLMIGAVVVATILEAVGFLYWLWLPLDEPTEALDHGVSVKRRAFLAGTGEFLSVIDNVGWSPDGKTLATTFGSFQKSTILWDVVRTKVVAN